MSKSVISDFLSMLSALFQPPRQEAPRPQGDSDVRHASGRKVWNDPGDGYYDSHGGENDGFRRDG